MNKKFYRLGLNVIPSEVYDYMKREDCEIKDLPLSIYKLYHRYNVAMFRRLNKHVPEILNIKNVFNCETTLKKGFDEDVQFDENKQYEMHLKDGTHYEDMHKHDAELVKFKVVRDSTVNLKGLVIILETTPNDFISNDIDKLRKKLYDEATIELGHDKMYELSLTNNLV